MSADIRFNCIMLVETTHLTEVDYCISLAEVIIFI